MSGSNYQLTFEDDPSTVEILYFLSIAMSVLTVVLFLVMTILDQKLPALELLLSSQLVYFALYSAGSNVGIVALRGLKYLNGYNDIFDFQVDLHNYQIQEVQSMGIFKEFILNYNFMALLQFLSILFMLPLKMHIWKFEKQKETLMNMTFDTDLKESFIGGEGVPTISQARQKIHKAKLLFKTYINRCYLPINVLCMSPIVFFFGIQNLTANTDNTFHLNATLSIVVSIIALFLCQGFMVYLFEESNKQRPVFSFFRRTIFYPFHLIFIYYFVSVLLTLTLSF